jgi:hypothetical protein
MHESVNDARYVFFGGDCSDVGKLFTQTVSRYVYPRNRKCACADVKLGSGYVAQIPRTCVQRRLWDREASEPSVSHGSAKMTEEVVGQTGDADDVTDAQLDAVVAETQRTLGSLVEKPKLVKERLKLVIIS